MNLLKNVKIFLSDSLLMTVKNWKKSSPTPFFGILYAMMWLKICRSFLKLKWRNACVLYYFTKDSVKFVIYDHESIRDCLLIWLCFLLYYLILGMEGIPSNPFLCGFSNRVYIFGCSMENLFATYMKGVRACVGGWGLHASSIIFYVNSIYEPPLIHAWCISYPFPLQCSLRGYMS